MYIIRFILGHEGKGSLLSYLRKKFWATELNAGDSDNTKLFTIFKIDIRLTENGFDHLDDVLAAVFSFLKFLQRARLNESVSNELRTAFTNVNRFAEEPGALDNVKQLGKNMLLYPSKFIITASNHFYDFDAEAVKKTIDHLNSRKFNIRITLNRSKKEQMVYNSTEPWFGIKYKEIEMPAKWIELHQKAEPFPEFTLPETNPFIADNFTIFNISIETSTFGGIVINDFCTLHYRPDRKPSKPYAEVYLYFLKPYARSIDK